MINKGKTLPVACSHCPTVVANPAGRLIPINVPVQFRERMYYDCNVGYYGSAAIRIFKKAWPESIDPW